MSNLQQEDEKKLSKELIEQDVACSGEEERVGEMDAKCKKQLPPTDRNTNSKEAADPSPPLATFEVPTEPLTSAVSSIYTLPEMYHDTNLYPSLGDDDVKEEDAEKDIHPKPTTKLPTCATAATATKRPNDNEDDKDVNSEQDALVSMVPIQPNTNSKKDPTYGPVPSKTATSTKMPNDNDDDEDENVISMDVLDFSAVMQEKAKGKAVGPGGRQRTHLSTT